MKGGESDAFHNSAAHALDKGMRYFKRAALALGSCLGDIQGDGWHQAAVLQRDNHISRRHSRRWLAPGRRRPGRRRERGWHRHVRKTPPTRRCGWNAATMTTCAVVGTQTLG